jgi:DNA helicase IV
VIGDPEAIGSRIAGKQRLRALTAVQAKGMEFDLVVLVDPASFGPGIEGAVDRYVAMTRATRQLVILS